MPRQNGALIDPAVGKKSIRRLGVGPILASQRDGLPEPTGQLPSELPEPSAKPRVTKPAAGQFPVESLKSPARWGAALLLNRLLEQFTPFMFWHLDGSSYTIEVDSSRHPRCPLNLWVIESHAGRLRLQHRQRRSELTHTGTSHRDTVRQVALNSGS